VLDDQLDRLAEQSLQQVRDLRDDVGQLQDLRTQRLLARKGEQLPGQAGGAVGIGLDLLDVVVVAVPRRVPHQHQVAMADDRRQDIVEVVRHAAGKLADDLHLGRLRNLALELRFLAIVLEQEEDRGVAEAAQPGDGQRHRVRRLPREAHRKVAGHRWAARIAPDRVGHRPLVLLHHQVAGIDGRGGPLDPGCRSECLVHGQEAAVAIDQRQADRQNVQQGLKVRRRLGPRILAFEQQESARSHVQIGIRRQVHGAKRPRRLSLGNQPHLLPLVELNEVCERRLAGCPAIGERAIGERTVGGHQLALAVDNGGHHATGRQPLARASLHAPRGHSHGVGRSRPGKAPQQKVAARPDPFDFDRAGPSIGLRAGHAARAVAPGKVACH
jgi:hypothetical protein